MQTVLNELAILEQVWDRSLDIALIAEPLVQCAADDSAASVRRRLDENNWDAVGVHRIGDAEAVAFAYVEREHLTGRTCGENAQAFVVDELVALQTPIRLCIGKLIERKRLFVLGREGVEKIVTVADLHKPPVRLMLFAAVSMLETAVGAAVRAAFPHEKWTRHLSKERIRSANEIQTQRKARKQDLDLLDCLQIGDKAELLLKTPGSPKSLGFDSKKAAKNFFEELATLRNNLAHAHSPVNGSTWDEVYATYRQAETLTKRLAKLDIA